MNFNCFFHRAVLSTKVCEFVLGMLNPPTCFMYVFTVVVRACVYKLSSVCYDIQLYTVELCFYYY